MFGKEIFEIIENAQSIIIGGHINPDGDAIASCLSLAIALDRMGKRPIVLLEEIASKYSVIKGAEFVYEKDDYSALVEMKPEVFFSVDCGDKKRLGEAVAIFDAAKITFNIDHHISNNSFAMHNYVNAGASSASEIMYEILKDNCDIDLDIATNLYAGIVFDTGGFKHSSTTARTHEIAARLVELGVDSAYVQNVILYEKTLSQVSVFQKALVNCRFDNDIAYTYLSTEEILSSGASFNDLDGICEYILNIKGIGVSFLVTERKNGFVKISFRSKKMDVNRIAAKFGGGGHVLASGASCEGSIEEIVQKVLSEIKNG